jgi:23S rRNA (guanosine2251-2'-O)-methyltransferase
MSKSQYITGLRAVEQILATESTDIRRIYAEYQTANPRVEAVIKMARQNNIEIQPANRARLMQISGESRHQGVVAEVRRSTLLDEAGLRTMVEERLQEGRPILLLVLDGVQDPLGPTVSKVAAGAAEQLPFVPVGNLGRVLGWLGDYGVRCVGTSDKADSTLFEADLGGSVALIMGREHTGLSKGIVSRCDTLVSLPMQGVVSSLNVSVATGICLYEIVRQRSGTN